MHDEIAGYLPGILDALNQAAEEIFELADALSDISAESAADAGIRGYSTPGWITNLYDLSEQTTKLAQAVESWDPTE